MTSQNCYALDFAGTDYPSKVFPSLCESCNYDGLIVILVSSDATEQITATQARSQDLEKGGAILKEWEVCKRP